MEKKPGRDTPEPQVEEPQDGGDDIGKDEKPKNILLIISDDQGLDASAQYSLSTDLPNTPTIDGFAQEGIVFDNLWATPSCPTTRGSLITGLHGIRTGVDRNPSLLDTELLTLQRHLQNEGRLPNYATAVIGKWHLVGNEQDRLNHPIESGVGFYAGTITGGINDYESWPLTQNGVTSTSSVYHTTAMTDLAIDWVSGQEDGPWFLWLAYVAPHSPYHLPPAHLHDRNLSGTAADINANSRNYFLAAIEAMDKEIGRLIDSLDEDVRENTLIVFMGDNGSPSQVIDTNVYDRAHGKGSLYEGGLRVPMIATGAGVERKNEREPGLINTVDFFSTFSEVAGIAQPEDKNSVSFSKLFKESAPAPREFNYSEFISNRTDGWAVRNKNLKLIVFENGTRELYDLSADLGEENNLLDRAQDFTADIQELEAFAEEIRAVQ